MSLSGYDKYIERFGYQEPSLLVDKQKPVKLIIVIPCHAEKNIRTTIKSLCSNVRPENSVEIIVVVNHAENANKEIYQLNQATVSILQDLQNNLPNWLSLDIIQAFDLPKKHAGVGLARKIGMDEALFRFHERNVDGLIVCLDADCTVSNNYLSELEQIAHQENINGLNIHFEHPLIGNYTEEVITGITRYELFLRYHNQGLKSAGLPYAFHTIGSSMAVRASAYIKQGGMNKRKAGEDFYFMHKIAQLGGIRNISTSVVYPSPRSSFRVPFGTGRAIQGFIENKNDLSSTYHPNVYKDLKILVELIPSFYEDFTSTYDILPESLKTFFEKNELELKVKEIKNNTRNKEGFLKRFYYYFDAFQCLKFVHFYRDEIQENIDLLKACQILTNQKIQDEKDMLLYFRELDKNNL